MVSNNITGSVITPFNKWTYLPNNNIQTDVKGSSIQMDKKWRRTRQIW